MPRNADTTYDLGGCSSHDCADPNYGYMDDYDWFCYFPSRNFLGTATPMFKYPYIGRNEYIAQDWPPKDYYISSKLSCAHQIYE